MYGREKRNPTIALGMTTAMAAVMLSGCAGQMPTRANVASTQAGEFTASPQVQAAEAAVAAEPQNAAHRMRLANAYLDAGRFAAASQTFEDAMALGENSPRAALSLALSMTGQARYAEAASLLSDWEGEIAASDVGLAFALAGQPERGIHILTNAIRGGDNTVKTRQNLAYAYAVAGRWREARMMAAQDVPAHEVGERMGEWAQMTASDAYQARVASLLGVPANVRDLGQPVHLALNPAPAAPQYAAAETPRMAVPATGAELPPVGAPAVTDNRYAAAAPQARPAGNGFASAFEGSTPAAAPSRTALAQASVQQTAPAAAAAPALAPLDDAPRSTEAAPAPVAAVQRATTASEASPAPRRAARAATPAIARSVIDRAPSDNPTHLVQLGSFSSEAGARRAWSIYQARYPELADREMVITQAVVRGRNYWRVSAGGFDRASSRAMCGRVAASNGDGCISWAANSPLPGAIDTGVRLARR